MTTKEIKLPEIVYDPKSWPKAEPREELGDNLYAVYLGEAERAWVSVTTKNNMFLYHDPNGICYALTDDTFGSYEDEPTFGREDYVKHYLQKGASNGFNAIELTGYDSNHPLVKKLVEMKDSDSKIKKSIKRARKRAGKLESELRESKRKLKKEFLPEGYFKLRD